MFLSSKNHVGECENVLCERVGERVLGIRPSSLIGWWTVVQWITISEHSNPARSMQLSHAIPHPSVCTTNSFLWRNTHYYLSGKRSFFPPSVYNRYRRDGCQRLFLFSLWVSWEEAGFESLQHWEKATTQTLDFFTLSNTKQLLVHHSRPSVCLHTQK